MRIIAGEYGGRKILAPLSETTRPITDRAKQSLFDTLGERVDGAVVLDAFAGTGSMGLECLSRGARRVVFIERDRSAVALLRKNIAALDVAARSLVLPVDAYRALRQAVQVREDFEPFGLAFVDPPYAHTEPGPDLARLTRLLAELAASALAPDGLISLRHPTAVSVQAIVPGELQIIRELTYGSMRVSWLARDAED